MIVKLHKICRRLGGAYFAHFQQGSFPRFKAGFGLKTNATVAANTFRFGGWSMGSTPTSANKVYPVDLALKY